ncbi:MAG TPA: hypothetical protein PKK95_05380 [Vicinamibacterales bacterium]|nr:hypothetical protein [Acidobacteriota bacterium]HOC17677.1 hypothetical protein [Vicinamibacterales bacterium]
MTDHAQRGHPDAHRHVMLVLAYLPPFAVIPMLVEKDDADLQWHARHGIVLMVAEMLILLGIFAIALVAGLLTAGIGCGLLVIAPVPMLIFLVLHLVIVVRAFAGRRLLIPIVSEYADRF